MKKCAVGLKNKWGICVFIVLIAMCSGGQAGEEQPPEGNEQLITLGGPIVEVEQPADQPEDSLISIDLKGVCLRDLFHCLKYDCGAVEVVAGPEVTGNVHHAAMKNVALGDALTAILKPRGYAWKRQGDQFMVAKLDDSIATATPVMWAPAKETTKGSDKPKTVSISLKGCYLEDLIGAILRDHDCNMVQDQMSVDMQPVHLIELPLDDTLNAIMLPYGYGYQKVGDIYVLGCQQNSAEHFETIKKEAVAESEAEAKQRVSLDVTDESLALVCYTLAHDFDRNMVVFPDVTGRVKRLQISNVPWEKALRDLLRSHGCGLVKSGNIYFITCQDQGGKSS